MGCAIGADDAGAVQGKNHREVLQCHVMNQLVVGALQEGRIDRHHRLEPLAGKPCGKGHRMLLGDADIMVALRKTAFELDHAGTLAHRRRDADQALVLLGHVAQPLPENLGEGRLAGRGRLEALGRIELARAMVGHRVGLGAVVALPLARDHVQELRAFEVPDVLQRRDQRVQIMAVNGTDVVEAELLEQRGRHHHPLGLFLQPFGQFEQRRRGAQDLLAHGLGPAVQPAAHELRQVSVQCAHRRADRHLVVVEHHQKLAILHPAVVQGLEGHAGTHGTIANDGHGVPVLAFLAGSDRHPQGGRDRG